MDVTKKDEKADVKPDEKKIEPSEKVLTESEVQALLKKKEEELTAAIDEAKKDAASKEKAKLYDTIEKAKTQAAEYEKQLKEFQAVEEEKRKAEEQRIKDEMDAKERMKIIENELDSSKKRFSEMLDLKDKEFNAELKKRDLAILRERLISEAKGEIIPEMVQGSTEEELKAAADLARTRYKDIVEAQKKQIVESLIKDGKIPSPDGTGKITESDKTAVSGGIKSSQEIFGMSEAEFQEYSKSVLSQYK